MSFTHCHANHIPTCNSKYWRECCLLDMESDNTLQLFTVRLLTKHEYKKVKQIFFDA